MHLLGFVKDMIRICMPLSTMMARGFPFGTFFKGIIYTVPRICPTIM